MHPYLVRSGFALAGFAAALLLVWTKVGMSSSLPVTTTFRKYKSLTASAALVLMAAVGAAMYFMHTVIGLHSAYWIVPVFGALGGLVGSLIRNANQLVLVTFDADSCKVRLGFVGDIVLGLGGRMAIYVLYGTIQSFCN